MNRIICIFILFILTVGCSSTKDLSQNSAIRTQIGIRQTIKRSCLLMSGQESWENVKKGEENWFRNAPYQLYDKDESSNSWRKEGWVPIGTELVIHSVKYHSTFETTYIDVLGTIYLKNSEPREFRYSWKFYSFEPSIKRAPWEDETIPEKRML